MARKLKYRKGVRQWSAGAAVEAVCADKHYADTVVYRRFEPGTPARFGELSPPLDQRLQAALRNLRINGLFSHQAEALECVRGGDNLIVATPTASGKTLIYNLPVFESCLADPECRALYIYPLKALEQDQKRKIDELSLATGIDSPVTSAVYDGDTSSYRRAKIRQEPPNIILTNPDMLHLSILASHDTWVDFLRNLRYVVVDELHSYRGIFGAHFSAVIARLKRVAAHYGACPQFITSSATIANPGEFAEKLFDEPFRVVDKSGAPAAGRHYLFINPGDISPATMASRLLPGFINMGLKTIAFTKSRRNTELIYNWISHGDRELAARISSYRSGYLPEERREIERRLADDSLDAVISTSALELGIDIGGLDACILVGYPGTVSSTLQRGGRVGRAERDSIVALIAQADALDQYFMRHPEDFFSRGPESAILDPENEYVQALHLICAAAEIPIRHGEKFIDSARKAKVLEELRSSGRLLEDMKREKLFSSRAKPHREVSLREAGESFSIIDTSGVKAAVIGSIGGSRALAECHQGAIYLHRSRQYLVTRLDLEKHKIYVEPNRDPYYTQVQASKDTEILEVLNSRPAGNFIIKYGRLKVTEQITGFQRRRISSQELLGTEELEMPPQVWETAGYWIEVPRAIEAAVIAGELHFMGGIHATEHSSIGVFPLFMLCDRNDIGGICFTTHPQVGGPAIFIYDGYPGGVGIARAGYDRIEEILSATYQLVSECPCEDGCPSCIHSPKCGSGNKPLDKAACILTLKYLLGRKTLPAIEPEKVEDSVDVKKKETGRTLTGIYPADKEIIVFDLETQKSADEVGGWSNKNLMRLSVAVAQNLVTGEVLTFTEASVAGLIELLHRADLVIGFNQIDFDYAVLSAYHPFEASRVHSFDILKDITGRIGHRLSLDSLAGTNLGQSKSADGLAAIRWFRDGQIEKIIDYCAKDVHITAELFEYGLTNQYLSFEHKKNGLLRINLDWDIGKMLA